jgi:hypothetical protein
MSINERFDLVLVLAPTQANQSPVMEPMSLGGSERFERISYPSEIVLVRGCKCHFPDDPPRARLTPGRQLLGPGFTPSTWVDS